MTDCPGDMLLTIQLLPGYVSYVVDPEKLKALAGTDWDFLLSPVRDSFYLTLIIATLAVVAVAFVLCERVPWLRSACRGFHDRLLTYLEFVPLVLRAALGIALIVAGTKNAIYLPNVPGEAVSTLEVVIGFCLIAGIMTRLCGLVAFGIYCYGLYTSHYMFGTMESAAAALLVAGYGGGRPSADDLFHIDIESGPLKTYCDSVTRNAGPILRLGLGGTMMWLAVTEKAMNPRVCEAVVVDFDLELVIPVNTAMWVFSVGVIEFAVGLVLFLGFFTRTFAMIAFVVLTLSFFYFKEEVAGHVTFFASLMTLMVTGAGRCSLDSLIASKTRGVRGTDVAYGPQPAPG